MRRAIPMVDMTPTLAHFIGVYRAITMASGGRQVAKHSDDLISAKPTTHLALNGLRTICSLLYLAFKGQKNLWQRGDFSTQSENNTLLVDPWRGSGDLNAPFDQSFYLILYVAVGSRNGWFPDGIGNKPWVDAGDTSALDFWNAANAWLPTWADTTDRGMIVKSVKMWQEGSCG
ncbi:glycoside hydrolase family 16 protein [Hyaloscypha variabilis F]|uniref:Glycoside hydrolase family 16 protein n=1 Tax=Hyaloscypha variabilis (strain UAMH 11265 / GT02V1 / F) TaxID=1149755 RepID=A0A2J6QU22_HYAVF|nr:glycoside hydrolase family 16 protein [Hyaloscypha variabilis F]